MEQEAEILASENINQALAQVRKKYFIDFRTAQDDFIQRCLNNQLHEGAYKEIASLSVPALDSIFIIANEAMKEIRVAIDMSIGISFRRFLFSLLLLVFSAMLIVLGPWYISHDFIKPLNSIIGIMENMSIGIPVRTIPFLERSDEVGTLAAGLKMLQDTMNKEHSLRKRLRKTIRKLENLSIRDTLTNLYNRRYAQDKLIEYKKLYTRNKKPFSMLMCDIDHFKNINDLYGHACGDAVLQQVSALLLSFCRESDILARWGGEEFLFILFETDLQGAGVSAERMRKLLEQHSYSYEDKQLHITMTFGAAEYNTEYGIDGTIKNADEALYKGKAQGRNQVVLYSE